MDDFFASQDPGVPNQELPSRLHPIPMTQQVGRKGDRKIRGFGDQVTEPLAQLRGAGMMRLGMNQLRVGQDRNDRHDMGTGVPLCKLRAGFKESLKEIIAKPFRTERHQRNLFAWHKCRGVYQTGDSMTTLALKGCAAGMLLVCCW